MRSHHRQRVTFTAARVGALGQEPMPDALTARNRPLRHVSGVVGFTGRHFTNGLKLSASTFYLFKERAPLILERRVAQMLTYSQYSLTICYFYWRNRLFLTM